MLPFSRILAAGLWIAASSLAQELNGLTPPAVLLKIVKGAPFTAQVVTESTQVLADGNHVVQRSTALITRDSEGRTRREQVPSAGRPAVVFIQDPVAGFVYVLQSQSHAAQRLVMPPPPMNAPAVNLKRGDTGTGEIRATRSYGKGEDLGLQVLDGVLAQGTRLKQTLAAGEAGNERSLDITSEAWYSDELQAIVMSRTVDPRVGEIVYKLTDVRRGEPDRGLFEVPADYTMTEMLRPQFHVEQPKNQ